jgi:hypothetical protein
MEEMKVLLIINPKTPVIIADGHGARLCLPGWILGISSVILGITHGKQGGKLLIQQLAWVRLTAN